ncbi:BamA/TamA family outer membrane protein [Piscinibacter sp. XHJ-5]|uniref:autotransporter assembly complex protein TamA n=1 Tax=Piscinibacter sp. XHJ-5 TaxID=3037797 RepID=UPI0024533A3D|nr:BamA/TamA family outer membrane protein [Piscinibacter sp. XHJ-5]
MRALHVVSCCLALMLASCSLFRAGKKDDDAAGASAARIDKRRAQYTLDVEAPRPLRQLLSQNLDLARFRDAPASEALSNEELDRLVGMAPEQARALLATEGYFNAKVEARRQPAASGEQPRVLVSVEPGPRTLVEGLTLGVQGELQQRADAGDADARALLARLREEWPLKPGEPFRQADWTSAKNATLGRLHADGYPSAIWIATDARVRSREQRVQLEASAQSGPLFHLGDLRIEGLKRYDERAVRNVATFRPGTPYSEQRLIDFQERLTRSGLFEGAVAEFDNDPQKAAAAPVTVRVQEQPLQKVTLGLGYSTDTGTRASVEHMHRQPFGLRWTAQNKFEIGPQRKAWEFDYRSYPKPGFRRNLVAGNVERWSGPDEERYAGRLRIGRAWEDPRLERQVYGEYTNARVRAPTGESRAQALTGNYDWTRRDVDSLLLPTRGKAVLLQGAVGYARSSTAENGPLARAYGRVLYFRPFARDWHATVRLEGGQVFARQAVGVPDTLLFRAGGEESVRGYEYRSLGPMVNGVVTSGRSLLTASAEVARPVSARLPQVWGAAFVDAGNAAARFRDIKPVVGVGVGVRYRSPVGPLKLDVAYGVDDKKVRMHLSAGVSF